MKITRRVFAAFCASLPFVKTKVIASGSVATIKTAKLPLEYGAKVIVTRFDVTQLKPVEWHITAIEPPTYRTE